MLGVNLTDGIDIYGIAIYPATLPRIGHLSQGFAYLQEQDIDSVRAFLDNDPVGRQALLTIQSSDVTVEDMSRHYARHKDLNEFLVAQREAQKQKIVPRKRGLRR